MSIYDELVGTRVAGASDLRPERWWVDRRVGVTTMNLKRLDRSPRSLPTRAEAGGYAVPGAVLSTVAPGVAAGLTGLVVFLSLHAVWVLPIWFVAPLGVVAATLGGVAVGWAFLQVEPRLSQRLVFRWLAVAGGAVLVLIPSLLVAWAGDPYFTVFDGVRRASSDIPGIALRFVVEFLVVTTLSGAALGWVVTRSRRGTVAVATAALAFALGPGHNLPFFHLLAAPAVARTGLLLTLATIVAASATFVVVDRVVRPVARDDAA